MSDLGGFNVKLEPKYARSSDGDMDIDEESSPRRKQLHIAAEQKRRDAIKKGYDNLQEIVPDIITDISKNVTKMSQAQILQKSLDYMNSLLVEKQKQDEELVALEKEVKGLQIMKENYEQIVKSNQLQVQETNEVTEQEKFMVFLRIMESMWQSFKDAVSLSTFQTLSSSIFSWLEKYCKPQLLKDTVLNAMRSTFNEKK